MNFIHFFITGEKSWINPTPQSYRFCRPLRICHEKEDSENIRTEYVRLNKEIRRLNNHRFTLSNGIKAKASFKVFTTMFDGKCVNAITNNMSTIKCPICLQSSNEFGKDDVDFTPVEGNLRFGIGLLHSEIKTFEHLLRLSYRLEVRVWNVNASVKGKHLYIIE